MVFLINSLNHVVIRIVAFLWLITGWGCRKLIEVPPPVDTITTSQVFSRAEEANSAIAAIYSDLSQGNNSFASYATTVFCGLSADELTLPATRPADWMQFYQNNLFAGNTYITNIFWADLYKHIYRSNALLEGLQNSTIKDSVKRPMEGQARFIRAFCNFYLVNLFGSVPLVKTINWRSTNLLSRSTESEVYQQIIDDLKEAEILLAETPTTGDRASVIPYKAAATALLSRVYLYTGDWINAEIKSSSLIDNPAFQLEPLNRVFAWNSTEAIWQLKQNNSRSPSYNVTPEGYFIRPRTLNSNQLPAVWFTEVTLNSFQNGDQRRFEWIDSTRYTVDNKWYYFPGKYKQGAGQVSANGTYSQYYMVLRLSEQYLIRAEARLKQNKLAPALEDINVIRQRSGLNALVNEYDTNTLMTQLVKESQAEFIAEWGHRWLDLKRWKTVSVVLSSIKGDHWQPEDQLYPIPQFEIASNPNLTQNESY